MKIFSLVPLAAILNYLTPVLATSNYKCERYVVGGKYADEAVDEAYAKVAENMPANFDHEAQLGEGYIRIKMKTSFGTQCYFDKTLFPSNAYVW
ncbi:BgtAcSP-30848 [Blumeria graminis f. sp. tritici]|uniref:BgtAcSP-30848 n=2 Tax=Blumeria graminis f. sp. tritici TaxID=62690 RepID=A0A9X9LAE3_BLUGR|nr:hypothetical protein BGT96224_AcSP30848 [Blumeria graminis f. sp. tritici 96224]VCU40792.1 BgtAcSP-30848 [Blumeria graminis f. sp. tritici]